MMNTTANTTSNFPGGAAMLAGQEIARIGFGAMQLPGPGVWGPPSDRTKALTVLRRAVEWGINHIDTAQFYGNGVSNELIHAALHPYPANLVLVSKVGAARDEQGSWIPAQHPRQLRASVEANLRTLAVEQINVVNLRIMDAAHDGSPIPDEQRVSLDDQLAEMQALRDEGKIGGIGLSNATLGQLQKALPAEIVCVQNAYSLLDRSAEPLLDLCREHAIAWVPFFPLGSAFPHMPKVTEHPYVIETASKLEKTPAQVGLAWLLAHAPNILLIPGTSNLDHLAENIAAGEVKLDAEAMNALDGLANKMG
ncbi:MAG TPA: aldo/keto reductase [Chitinophagaceae bacterium]|nr:aldo/keto reductase [Chitinophagaceae bacterium]